jgi:hypothetical protein
MFRSISANWELIKASAAVLRSDKELIVCPFISAVATLIVTATFAAPLFLAGIFSGITTGQRNPQVAGIVIGFLFYLVQNFIIFFMNTALVGAAMLRLQGGQGTVSAGFQIALQRTGPIFGYALIAATVGVILRWIAERFGVVGQIVASLLGLNWNLATYLVVPILVVENVGPIEAIQGSTRLLKRTWGEQIVGNIGFGAVFGLLTLAVMLLGAAGVALAASTRALALIVGVVVVVAFLALGLVSSALGGIYRAALYRYAATGQIAAGFSPDLIQGAFRQKRSRSFGM